MQGCTDKHTSSSKILSCDNVVANERYGLASPQYERFRCIREKMKFNFTVNRTPYAVKYNNYVKRPKFYNDVMILNSILIQHK